jgi:hypothetical protein
MKTKAQQGFYAFWYMSFKANLLGIIPGYKQSTSLKN